MSSNAAHPRAMPQPGDKIDGKYALIRVLGAGGMGVVFEAEHLRLKQRCAIKMLSPEMLREADIIHRFEREARASALLKSPHVTRVTDVATTPDGVPYIVMELLTGRDLDGELQHRGRIPCAEAVDYLLQACAAVGEAHAAGIIHRDLKPGNLFLANDPDGVIVKVLDFGISKMMEDESKLTSAGMTMGTALYMSPEQLRSAAKVDARSDIWSLGVILYELLCGQPPFMGSAPQVAAAIVSEDAPDLTQRCDVPPALAAIVHRMLRRAPAERFASTSELATALVPFAAPGSLGATVAAQLSRRISTRSLNAELAPAAASGDAVTEISAPPALRDVSTSVSHEVSTSLRNDSSSRQLLIAALAAIVLIAATAVAVAVFIVRRSQSDHAPTAASSASAPTAAGGTAASVDEARVAPPVAATAANDAPPAPTPAAAPPPTGTAAGAATSPTPITTATAKREAGGGTTTAPPAIGRPIRPAASASPITSAPARPTAPSKPAPAPSPAATAPQFL
jgi:serine/threonine-protein kinase